MVKITQKQSRRKQPNCSAIALMSPEAVSQTHRDILYSAMFLSVMINLFVFITWLVARASTDYKVELFSILFP